MCFIGSLHNLRWTEWGRGRSCLGWVVFATSSFLLLHLFTAMTVYPRMHRNRPSDICQGNVTMLSMHDTTYFHRLHRFLFRKSKNRQNCYCFLALCCFAFKCIESLLQLTLAARGPRVLVKMKEKILWRSINLGGLGMQEVKVVHDEDVSLLWATALNNRVVVARALQSMSVEITSVEVFAIETNLQKQVLP